MFSFVKKNKHLLDISSISANPQISWPVIYNNPRFPWDFNYASLNPNITPAILTRYSKKPWNYTMYSMNKSCTLDFVLKNLDKDWNFYFLSSSLKISWDEAIQYLESPFKDDISSHSVSSFSTTETEPDKSISPKKKKLILDISALGANENIRWRDIINNQYYQWNFHNISKNHTIGNDPEFLEFIRAYPDRMDWLELSKNPSIKWNVIKENPDLPWNYDGVSGNFNIDLEIVRNNINLPWNFAVLSANPSITWEDIYNNPLYNWNYTFASENPNITLNIISRHIKPWSYGFLSKNKMACHPYFQMELYKKKLATKFLNTIKIELFMKTNIPRRWRWILSTEEIILKDAMDAINNFYFT